MPLKHTIVQEPAVTSLQKTKPLNMGPCGPVSTTSSKFSVLPPASPQPCSQPLGKLLLCRDLRDDATNLCEVSWVEKYTLKGNGHEKNGICLYEPILPELQRGHGARKHRETGRYGYELPSGTPLGESGA